MNRRTLAMAGIRFTLEQQELLGINPEIIGVKNPARCLERWKKSYFKQGDVGLIGEKRGCSRNGRHKVGDLTIEDLCIYAEVSISGYYKWLTSSDIRKKQLRHVLNDYF